MLRVHSYFAPESEEIGPVLPSGISPHYPLPSKKARKRPGLTSQMAAPGLLYRPKERWRMYTWYLVYESLQGSFFPLLDGRSCKIFRLQSSAEATNFSFLFARKKKTFRLRYREPGSAEVKPFFTYFLPEKKRQVSTWYDIPGSN